MKLMKRTVVVLLAVCVAVCFAACGSSDGGSGQGEPMVGGWQMSDQNDVASLPKDVRAAFDKAAEGTSLEPVAYVGSQVVAGSNYMILCRETGDAGAAYKMVVVYADLDGNAEIIYNKDFAIDSYTEGEGAAGEAAPAGGWTIADDAIGIAIPEEAQGAFE